MILARIQSLLCLCLSIGPVAVMAQDATVEDPDGRATGRRPLVAEVAALREHLEAEARGADPSVGGQVAELLLQVTVADDRELRAEMARLVHVAESPWNAETARVLQAWWRSVSQPATGDTGRLSAALDACEATQESAHPIVLGARLRLALLSIDQGLSRRAYAHLQTVADSADPSETPGLTALTLSGLGIHAQRTGDVEAATEHHDLAARIAREMRGPLPAAVLMRTAQFHRQSGDPRVAVELFEAALGVEGLQPWQRTEAELGLCEVESFLGRFARVTWRLDRLMERAGRTSSPRQLVYWKDLGHLLYRVGRDEEAERVLDRVLAEAPTGSPVRVDVLLTVALQVEKQQRLEDALERLEEAVLLIEETSVQPWSHIAVLINRGRLQRRLEDFDAAEATFHEVVPLCEANGMDQLTVAAWNGLAMVYEARGELDRAAELMAKVVLEFRSLNAIDYLLESLADQAGILLDRGHLAGVAGCLAEADHWLGESSELSAREAAAVRSRHTTWGRLGQDLVVAEGPGAADPTGHLFRGLARASEWKGRALLAEVRRHSPASTTVDPVELLQRVQDHLAEDELLVDFVAGRERLYAYVMSDRKLDLLDLGVAAEIEQQVWEYIEQVFVRPQLTAPGSVRDAGRPLCDLLLGPVLEGHGSPVRQLILVPNEWLAGLPFAALVVDSKEPCKSFADLRYVIEEHVVTYAPSSLVLGELLGRELRRPPKALLLGDAVFEPDSGLQRLKRSRPEVLHIADLLIPVDQPGGDELLGRVSRLHSPRTRDGHVSSDHFELALGHRASRDWFQRDLGEFGLVHVATHGVASDRMPSRSGLVLSPDGEGESLVDLGMIQDLALSDPMVVLSACETARGRILRGEGVQSLALAFLEGGAATVLATLWKIEDPVAEDLMQSFYAEWLMEGVPPATALHEAKLKLRHRRGDRGVTIPGKEQGSTVVAGHPSLWAPVVLIGLQGL